MDIGGLAQGRLHRVLAGLTGSQIRGKDMSAWSETRQVEPKAIDLDLEGDTLREECGVFGIYRTSRRRRHHGPRPACPAASRAGSRGHRHIRRPASFISSAGSASSATAFPTARSIERLEGRSAIGHVRYSTTGETILRNVQPLFAELDGGGFAVAHNGNLTNGLTLRRDLIRDGAICQSTTDTEVIVHLVARSREERVVDRFLEAVQPIEGAFSLVALTNKKLIGARDPLGIRPLVLGELDGRYILTSETCALDIIGARFVRDIENGEVVVISDDGIESYRFAPKQPARPCIFEYIYFARPDSIVNGRSVYDVRKNMGAAARARIAGRRRRGRSRCPIPACRRRSVSPSAPAFPYELGIIRNHYVGRTFIQPTQSVRELGVRMKHSRQSRGGRGQAHRARRRQSRARHHVGEDRAHDARSRRARKCISASPRPPITHPDFYGIDTPEKDKLLAATHDLEQMRAYIGADSLAFLSVDGLYRSMGEAARNPAQPQFTDHCFTGDYPTPLTDLTIATPRRLSLLAEAD